MLIPRTIAEVTSEWLQHVFQNYVSSTIPGASFHINTFLINPGTKPGENFNSDLINVEVVGQVAGITECSEEVINKCRGYLIKKSSEKALEESDEEKRNRESGSAADVNGISPKNSKPAETVGESLDSVEILFNIMIKIASPVIFWREMNRYSNNHLRELTIYADVHKRLTKLQEDQCDGKYKLSIPDIYYSRVKGEDFVIAVKNLKYEGFILNDKNKGLNLQCIKLAIVQIARWHALTYVYNEKYNLLKEFPVFYSDYKNFKIYAFVFEISLNTVSSFVSDMPEFSEFSKRLRNWKEIIGKMKNICYKRRKRQNGIFCLIHGDFWNNNLLYRFDEDDNPVDISLVDWQMCQWNRRVIDLHYLLHTSTTYEFRKENLEEILKLYYSTFGEVVASFNLVLPDMTYEIFKKEYDDASVAGLLYGLALTMLTLSRTGEDANVPKNPEMPDVRSLTFNLKTSVAKLMTSVPQLTFIMKNEMKKMLKPVGRELQEGKNQVIISRTFGLLREAQENGTLKDINPI